MLTSSKRYEMLALSGMLGPNAQKAATSSVYFQAAIVLTSILGMGGYFLLHKFGIF